ncbi:MAG TPA: MlaD family protein [Solirubrobacteraceae bacterium]|nr:MlaD family protein [Solirubrobacteraceae bacterium]
MRYVALVALVLVLAAAVVVVATGDDNGGDYKVRAIFENAGFVIPGEDVKVAGVKVGTIDSLDVTDDFKAAVVLDITDPGYQDFRQDAECIVRPQSLIGERFVECEPTQARAAGTEPPPKLEQIDDGPGKGQYLLPVENTSKAVDLDLINNIMQRPVRERLSIILSDLGIGVAGRGKDLSEVIRRADPALKEIDKVLRILAGQNDTLERLAVDSDTILAPLARERRHVSGAIENSSEVAQATAERRVALEADIERLPLFLRELTPTMVRLGALSDEMTPVLTDLGAVAPDVNRMILELGPFSSAAIPAFESLGEAADRGTPAVIAARPVITDLRRLAAVLKPVGLDARKLLVSLQKTGGIQRAMDYVFFQAAGINGFDSFGHYLRAGLIVNQCANYSVQPAFGCSANFTQAGATSALAAAESSGDPQLVATARALAGLKPRKPTKDGKAKKEHKRDTRDKANAPKAEATPTPTATPAPAATPEPTEQEKTDTLLDYLFGGDE